VGISAPAGHTGMGFLNIMSDAGGCDGKTTGIQGSTLPADGSYTWTGTPLNRPRPEHPLALQQRCLACSARSVLGAVLVGAANAARFRALQPTTSCLPRNSHIVPGCGSRHSACL
jgi:hypothetical protein